MVAISTGPRTWRPQWIEEAEAPVFQWRVPTVTERELFEGGMAAYNALAVYPWDIGAQFRAGLAALLPEDPGEAERLDQLRERQVAGEELTPPEAATIDEATGALMQYWPGYRLIVAQAARREAVLPLVSFRTFVTGWEAKPGTPMEGVALVRGIDGMIADAVVAQIDPLIVRNLGIEIYSAMYARGAEKTPSRRRRPAAPPGLRRRRRRRMANRQRHLARKPPPRGPVRVLLGRRPLADVPGSGGEASARGGRARRPACASMGCVRHHRTAVE